MLEAIAIDGPSAAGKSTVAKALAKKLGMSYLDTGAMYRALALYLLEAGVDLEDEGQVNQALEGAQVQVRKGVTYLNGEDVGEKIRTDQVSKAASLVSSYKEVRDKLKSDQREMAKAGGVILDGRDIGTVVLPDARLKIFLTASPEVRARRRLHDEKRQGEASYEEVLADLKARDQADSQRKIAPLKPAGDSIILDSSDLSLEEVVDRIASLWEE